MVNPHPGGAVWRLHENLARLKHGLPVRRGDLGYIRRVAALNPADHQHKLLILEAERLRQKGAAERCLIAYANAVEMASSSSSRLEAGVAAECAAAAARSFGGTMSLPAMKRSQQASGMHGVPLPRPAAKPMAEVRPAPQVAPQVAQAEMKAALAHRSERAKSRFLAEVGHELRTPLQGMQGLLDLAAEAPSEVSMSELREVFGSLKTVVDDLTDLAALGGGAPLNLKPPISPHWSNRNRRSPRPSPGARTSRFASICNRRRSSSGSTAIASARSYATCCRTRSNTPIAVRSNFA